jgi:hypothetical protein
VVDISELRLIQKSDSVSAGMFSVLRLIMVMTMLAPHISFIHHHFLTFFSAV